MGNSMHSLKTLLQLPCGWRCSRQIISSDALHLHGKRKTAQCPECFKRSDSVHSCRRRRIQHLPCAYSALFDHGLASKFDQRFASIRSTGNLTFSTAF
ncbi:hypothetical protein GQM14_15885 [Escherichia coli]|nr:hypothetical protein GP649_15885 [Escherichia coli]MWK75574.1 hypothetical protein [Escherichia coli]